MPNACLLRALLDGDIRLTFNDAGQHYVKLFWEWVGWCEGAKVDARVDAPNPGMA
jgi:hypothetical protein